MKQEIFDELNAVCLAKKPKHTLFQSIFCPYAWFQKERLHSDVENLIYWRDTRTTGLLFTLGLGLFVSLAVYSIITVVSYICLLVLNTIIAFKFYKSVMLSLGRTPVELTILSLMEVDWIIPEKEALKVISYVLIYANRLLLKLRKIVLDDDLTEAIKLTTVLWLCTYIGQYFNALTLFIYAFVGIFTLPVIYEHNKVFIDGNIQATKMQFCQICQRAKKVLPKQQKGEKLD